MDDGRDMLDAVLFYGDVSLLYEPPLPPPAAYQVHMGCVRVRAMGQRMEEWHGNIAAHLAPFRPDICHICFYTQCRVPWVCVVTVHYTALILGLTLWFYRCLLALPSHTHTHACARAHTGV